MTGEAQSDRRARLLRLATTASITVAAVLIVAKLIAWGFTGSVSVLASLVDSLMDAGASLINLIAVRYALMPPDAEHRFGHGKAESLAGLAQATFVAGSAAFLVLEGIDRLRHPRPLTDLGIGLAVMAFAIVASLILLAIQRYVIRRTGSTAIRADALHYATDLLTNGSTIVALGLIAAFGWVGIDAWLALVIAVYILYGAGRIGWDALQALMDRELSPAERERITAIALAPAAVRGVHGLRTRLSGSVPIIQLHLELDGDLPLSEAHRIADGVDAEIRAAFPGADVLIHQDPVGHDGSSDREREEPPYDGARPGGS